MFCDRGAETFTTAVDARAGEGFEVPHLFLGHVGPFVGQVVDRVGALCLGARQERA